MAEHAKAQGWHCMECPGVFGGPCVNPIPTEEQYDYSVQYTINGRVRRPAQWMSKSAAIVWLNTGAKSGDGEFGPWSKKLVKRRKAGEVQHA